MSKLQELIDKLCPHGVEVRCLDECCNILDNLRKPVKKADRVGGEYPYYGANGIQDYVSDYIFDGSFVLVGEDGSVVTKQGKPVVTWASGKIWVNNHAHIIEEVDGVMLRYLFHYLQTVDVTLLIHGSIPKLTGRDFKALKIPLPPLPVQEEIVRILDLFTELTKELTKELELRKKQYAYYRDKLLSFEGDVEYKSIKELYEYRRGSFPQPYTNKSFYGGENAAPFVQVADVCDDGFCLVNKTKQTISELAQPKSVFVEKGTVIVTLQGTIGRVAITQYDAYVDRTLAIFTSCKVRGLDKRYFAYCLKAIFDEKKKLARGSTIKTITKKEFSDFAIPIPPLEEQRRIAATLDKFDALVNSLTAGIPAEINARQKQYEYYRDKLLTFEELQV